MATIQRSTDRNYKCKMPSGKSAASHNRSGVATTIGDEYGLLTPTAVRDNSAASGRTMAGQNGSVEAFVMAFIALISFFEFRHHMYEYCFLVVRNLTTTVTYSTVQYGWGVCRDIHILEWLPLCKRSFLPLHLEIVSDGKAPLSTYFHM